MNERPSPGDLLIVDGAASVQFAGDRALRFRVVSVGADDPYPGWLWLTGYVIDRRDRAVAKREIYVQFAGLRPVGSPTQRPVGRNRSSAGRDRRRVTA